MTFNINSPEFNDNRNYSYNGDVVEMRAEYKYFIENIPENSSVLDLGCGDGTLLGLLRNAKKCKVKGIEISESGVAKARLNNIDVLQGSIDKPLPFDNGQFDFAICNTTIQMVMYPEVLMNEMLRVSASQIISFPNFAFYKNRLQLLLRGVMPVHCLFGYAWYNTGHIHQLSCRDFELYIHSLRPDLDLTIVNKPAADSIKNYFIRKYPNMFEIFPIYHISHRKQ